MATKEKIIEHTIVNFEGVVYTNVEGDYGGPTKFGITQATLSKFLGRPVTALEVKSMSMDLAIKVYTKNYWNFWKLDTYPVKLQHLIFDLYVQHSPKAVGKIIQNGVVLSGQKVIVDGDIGQKTMDAINCIVPEVLLSNITKARVDYYNYLVQKDPVQKKFLKGWLNRANWFLKNSLDK